MMQVGITKVSDSEVTEDHQIHTPVNSSKTKSLNEGFI